jgi:hypothetical protein
MSSGFVIDVPGCKVLFAGGYQCAVPSVVEAIANTEIEIEGIAGVVAHQYSTRIYPRGRFCCGNCGERKEMDNNNHACAVRSYLGACDLVCNKLVCEDCLQSDDFPEGCRVAALAHEDFYMLMRFKAMKVVPKKYIKRWFQTAKVRKERREFALNSSLVFREVFEGRAEGWNQMWGIFLKRAV